MTMNYCGRCGVANGTAARYCRQCGAELHNQAAMSSSSTPLNVEFSARSVPKDHQLDAKFNDTRFESYTAVPPEADTGKLGQAEEEVSMQTNGGNGKDPKAISESLKRLRASGPLVIEAVKKKQERISQIIAESIESKVESKVENRREGKGDNKIGRNYEESKTALTAVQTQAAPPSRTASNSANTTISQRKATGSLMSQTSMRSATPSGTGHGQVPPQGPSSVLAQASGLEKNPNFGSKLRISLIAAIVVLSGSSYFLLRDRLAVPSRLLGAGRNLKSVEEQGSDLVKQAQRDREQGHYDAAIGYFQNALALTPNNSETRFLLAQTQLSAGQTDEALRSYHTVLRAFPEHLEARLQIAEIHRSNGNWAAALPEYKRVIAYDQTTPQAAFALEAIETYVSGKVQPEIVARRKGVPAKARPVDLPGGGLQVDISLQPPRMAAITSIKPPITNRPEDKPDPRVVADGHKKLGLRFYNIREYPAAVKEFLSAYRLNPEDKDLLYFIGSCYYGLEQFALAHDYFKRVDSGNYVGVAQSNATRTEKAAKEEIKRRELMKGDQLNQVKVDPIRKTKGNLNGPE